MIDLLDRAIETTPELKNDYIGDIIKKIQKPADKVRAYAANIGLPEDQIVLPFQVLAALYEFNLNNVLRVNESEYLETITKCAYRTVDFILATNNYFGDIESYTIPIQFHIDGLFIRNLINIIVSYFPNFSPEVQQTMRQMLMFQLTQTIFNLGKGDKSILTPVLKQYKLFQKYVKNKRGGAADDINVQSGPTESTEQPAWDDLGYAVEDYNDEAILKQQFEVPAFETIELDNRVYQQIPMEQDEYETIDLYGVRLPTYVGAEHESGALFNILDLTSKKSLQNLQNIIQSALNQEYNRNPNARRLIDSISLKVYQGNDGFVHIDGLPKQYVGFVNQTLEKILKPAADKKTYYAVPAKNFINRTPKPIVQFTPKAQIIGKRDPLKGPEVKKMRTLAQNKRVYDSDPEIATRQRFMEDQQAASRKVNEAEEKAAEERNKKLTEEQKKIKSVIALKRNQIRAAIREWAAYDNILLTDEEIDEMIDFHYQTGDTIMAAKAGQFVIDSLNTTAAYEYDKKFTKSMEFLGELDKIAAEGNFTSVYEEPTIFGIISYSALGLGLMQGAYWWNTLSSEYLEEKPIEAAYEAKAKAAQEAIKQSRMGLTKDDFVKLDSKAVAEFEKAMRSGNVMEQGMAAEKVLKSAPRDAYIAKSDLKKLTQEQTKELADKPLEVQSEVLASLLVPAIKDGVEVAQAVAAAQKSSSYDDLKKLLAIKGIRWGGTAVLFFGGLYFTWKGANLAWQRIWGNAFDLQHIDPQVFHDFGWPINATETKNAYSGVHVNRIDALAIHYNRLVSDASIAAGMLSQNVIDHIENESKERHYPFHFKCELYIRAAGLYNNYLLENTPQIPELFMEQFKPMLDELKIYESTTIPQAIVTLEAEQAFFENLESHIDNLPLIQRMVTVLEELDKLYQEYNRVATILEEQRSAFPIKKAKFEQELEDSTKAQLGRLNKEKTELDNRYKNGVAELSKEYGISKEEVDTLLKSSTNFEDVAKAFTKIMVDKATEKASKNLEEREKQSKIQKTEFEDRAKKYVTDWGLNQLREWFFEHSKHGWDNKFEKFIEAGDIHNSIGLATSLLAFIGGFGSSLAYLKSLWSDEQPGWLAQMFLFIGSAYSTYIASTSVAAFTAIGVAPWLAITIASAIGLLLSIGVTGRIAVTAAVKMWKGFKAGSLLWRWATGAAGISEEKADAIAEAANIGASALTGALSNGFSEILSPFKLPNAALNLGSQLLPRPLKPLVAPIKAITEPLSSLADKGIKVGKMETPELSQKSREVLFPWMKKKTEEKPKVEEKPKETKKEEEQKLNDSVQNVNPSKIPTKDGKSTEPISSKKLKTKQVKSKTAPKSTKQKMKDQTKDLHMKQLAKLLLKNQKLKPRSKLTLKVGKPTPKKRKTSTSNKRSTPPVDLLKIFSSPFKKARFF